MPPAARCAADPGARGFLAKDGPVEELAAAIRKFHAGEEVIDMEAVRAAQHHGWL